MTKFTLYTALLVVLISCTNKPVVEVKDIDSLLKNYSLPASAIAMEQDLLFWKQRAETGAPDLVNKQKYAQALAARFHVYGDVNDMIKADSIYRELNTFYKEKEPGILLTLAGYSMLQHRFKEARSYIYKTASLKASNYAVQMMLFDAEFELGGYLKAASILRSVNAPKDYAYNFRLSRYDHYDGVIDSAVAHMQRAADLAQSPYLKQAALSNVADMYMHKGDVEQAYITYRQCFRLNSSDFHSLAGIGWIALVKDGNDSLARRIFAFVQQKRPDSPDPLWRLMQAYELNDPATARQYAKAFAGKVTSPRYGDMYNKYLVSLYTDILKQPAQAVSIARKEVGNRPTPQTYAWLSWAYSVNNQPEEAYEVFQKNVSGKRLEALELFWMGKMMMMLGKTYNAKQFFKVAEENRFDLSPKQQQELKDYLR